MDIAIIALLIAIIAMVGALGTFILEVWAFKRLITLLEPIQLKVDSIIPQGQRAGDILADGVISLMERMGAETEDGERTRSAFGSVVLYGAKVAMTGIGELLPKRQVKNENGEIVESSEVSPLDMLNMAGAVDLSQIPRKYRDKVAMLQVAAPFIQMIANAVQKGKNTPNDTTTGSNIGWIQ